MGMRPAHPFSWNEVPQVCEEFSSEQTLAAVEIFQLLFEAGVEILWERKSFN